MQWLSKISINIDNPNSEVATLNLGHKSVYVQKFSQSYLLHTGYMLCKNLEILKLIVVNSQYYTLGVTMHCQRSSDYGGTWPGNTFCFCNYYF